MCFSSAAAFVLRLLKFLCLGNKENFLCAELYWSFTMYNVYQCTHKLLEIKKSINLTLFMEGDTK